MDSATACRLRQRPGSGAPGVDRAANREDRRRTTGVDAARQAQLVQVWRPLWYGMAEQVRGGEGQPESRQHDGLRGRAKHAGGAAKVLVPASSATTARIR